MYLLNFENKNNNKQKEINSSNSNQKPIDTFFPVAVEQD